MYLIHKILWKQLLLWVKNGWKNLFDLKLWSYPVVLGINSCLQICNFYARRLTLNNSDNLCIKPTHYQYISLCLVLICLTWLIGLLHGKGDKWYDCCQHLNEDQLENACLNMFDLKILFRTLCIACFEAVFIISIWFDWSLQKLLGFCWFLLDPIFGWRTRFNFLAVQK